MSGKMNCARHFGNRAIHRLAGKHRTSNVIAWMVSLDVVLNIEFPHHFLRLLPATNLVVTLRRVFHILSLYD
jgi:hypothetical protein